MTEYTDMSQQAMYSERNKPEFYIRVYGRNLYRMSQPAYYVVDNRTLIQCFNC